METQINNFTNSIINGELNINNFNFIDNCIEICKKNDTNLLHIYSIIKNGIEDYYKNMINENNDIKINIVKNIKEWSLNISPHNIFNNNHEDEINIDNYNNFLHENMIYNEINKEYNNIKSIDTISESILLDLNSKVKRSIDIINDQINLFKSYILIIEPNYNYLIIDLSNIKINNLNIILLNYIYIINFIKKEYHYLICLSTSTIENLLKINYDLQLQYNKLID
jgi:hypothetical protein